MAKLRTGLDVPSAKKLRVGKVTFLPEVGSMQVDLDMPKYKVHHSRKIDTARFKQGKRCQHSCALRMGEHVSRCFDASSTAFAAGQVRPRMCAPMPTCGNSVGWGVRQRPAPRE